MFHYNIDRMLSSKKLYDKSYEITFIMMVCITVLTFVRSINSNIGDKKTLSLQLSSFVTMIASMHYYLMIINKDNVTTYRYFDWFFTTPILLIDLCILLDIYDPTFIAELIIYNTAMLGIGFIGELGYMNILASTTIGFVPLAIMFTRLRMRLQKQGITSQQNLLLNTFFGLWSLYGVNNLVLNNMIHNALFNGLDFLTKGVFGLYIYQLSWQ